MQNSFTPTVTIGDIMDERARELYLEEWRYLELSRVTYCSSQVENRMNGEIRMM